MSGVNIKHIFKQGLFLLILSMQLVSTVSTTYGECRDYSDLRVGVDPFNKRYVNMAFVVVKSP